MTEGQIKTTQDTIFYLAGWQKKIRKADTIYGQYCKETDTFITWHWECKLVQPPQKVLWCISGLQMYVPFEPTISLLD